MSCNLYGVNETLRSYGKRCTGSKMACSVPWYTDVLGNTGIHQAKCSDRSDEIFEEGLTCRQHLQKHIEFHQDKFCNNNYPEVNSTLICLNKTQWLSTKDPSLSDPQNCQSSCAIPGTDCIACSNSSYFPCFKSGHCIPPELVCDGHPQCPNGEDENLDLKNCHDKYIEKHIVEPYASYRCKSPFYSKMDIYATPCDKKIECFDESGRSL